MLVMYLELIQNKESAAINSCVLLYFEHRVFTASKSNCLICTCLLFCYTRCIISCLQPICSSSDRLVLTPNSETLLIPHM